MTSLQSRFIPYDSTVNQLVDIYNIIGLYPDNSLIDGDSIPVEFPCVCLAPYFVKGGLISLLSPDDT